MSSTSEASKEASGVNTSATSSTGDEKHEPNNLMTFKAIQSFVGTLGDLFEEKQYSLKLYKIHLSKTKYTNIKARTKHIDAFKDFCKSYESAILNKDKKQLNGAKISYSDHVFIDVEEIFKLADEETQNTIWKHLLTIGALLFPHTDAKNVLKEDKSTKEALRDQIKSKGKEGEFIANIMDAIPTDEKTSNDPMAVLSSIMKPEVMGKIFSSFQQNMTSGNFDLGKMVGVLQSVIGKDTEIGNMLQNIGKASTRKTRRRIKKKTQSEVETEKKEPKKEDTKEEERKTQEEEKK